MASHSLLLSISLLLSFFTIALSDGDSCVYTIYVRTGSIFKAGTDSIISLKLYNSSGEYVSITDLESWGGLMGLGHNYFERDNLDIFSGRGPCLSSPICAMNISSDGSGSFPGWYVNYVKVTTTGVHTPCTQQLFTVKQWLALDAAPYELSTIRNYCPYYTEGRPKRSSA